MIKNRPNAHATHFRLSPESWLLILEAYREGATAKELAAKWKVAPGTIYRYVRERGFTKKANSDAIARAHAQMIADEEAADLAGGALIAADLPDATPAALKRRALEDMARAMAAGRVVEADRLARLLLTLGKVSGSRGDDDDDMDDDEGPRKVGPMSNTYSGYIERLFPLVEEIAVEMLGDSCHGPAVFSRAAMRWRAATFGPECAANDYQQMRARGWAAGVYDEDGNILPGWDSPSMRHPQVDPPPGYKGFDKDRDG